MSGLPLTLDDVLAARETLVGRVHRTPTFSSRALGERMYLKGELFQRTGSFKARGLLNKVAQLTPEERARGLISISAGNHAQALAYAAAAEGVDALLVTWSTASAAKVAATRAYGATVDLEAPDVPSAFERLDELRRETGRVFVRPWNDPAVMAGHGTVALDLLDDVPETNVVVVGVGGGGLVSGVATAVAGRARVIAVEPELAPGLHESMRAGRAVTIEPRSIADGLNAPTVGDACLEICLASGVESVLVSEEEIADAFRFLYTRAKLACEPAGAAPVAALLSGKVALEQGETVVAVISGGNVDPETTAAILSRR
jgi:threonine dehydratase